MSIQFNSKWKHTNKEKIEQKKFEHGPKDRKDPGPINQFLKQLFNLTPRDIIQQHVQFLNNRIHQISI